MCATMGRSPNGGSFIGDKSLPKAQVLTPDCVVQCLVTHVCRHQNSVEPASRVTDSKKPYPLVQAG